MSIGTVIVALEQQDFLDMYDRLFPDSWIVPIKSIGPGYELLQGYGAVGARISAAVANLASDVQFLTAQGGAFATGVVQLSRPAIPTTGATVPGQTGSNASIVTGASAGNIRITGLTNMSAASVGRFLQITATANIANTGGFLIAQFNNPTSVDVVNATGVVPDSANGSIEWAEQDFTVTVKAGTIVTASDIGAAFATLQDQIFIWSDLGPFNVPVQAVAFGYEYNVSGALTTAGNEFIFGEIDTVTTLVEDPALGDTSIQVTNAAPTTGGRDAALDALGFDRGMPRNPGEADTPYRNRIRQLPDTVSPNAIQRTVDAVMRPIHASYEIIETWDPFYQSCWDAPLTVAPGVDFDVTLGCWDDPRPSSPMRDRWLDAGNCTGGIIVVVEDVQPIQEYGACWDDTSLTAADLVSPDTGGMRAICAWDAPDNIGFGYLQSCWDGQDLGKSALYLGLYTTLQNIKPAGCPVSLELAGQ